MKITNIKFGFTKLNASTLDTCNLRIHSYIYSMKERKFSKNQIAEIRAKLMQDGTVFNCFGEQWKVSKSTS